MRQQDLREMESIVREAMEASRRVLPAELREEIEARDDRWRWWGVFPDARCDVPIVEAFTASTLLAQMATGLIEDHPGAYQGITAPAWEYGWYPKPGDGRCWLLKPSQRKIAINSDAATRYRLTNRQVRVQLHEAMLQAEHGITMIFDRIAQRRRPRGATNKQMRLLEAT